MGGKQPKLFQVIFLDFRRFPFNTPSQTRSYIMRGIPRLQQRPRGKIAVCVSSAFTPAKTTHKKKKKVRRRGSGNWLRPTGKAVGSPAEIFRKPFVCALNPVTPAMTRATARRVERSAHARDALAAPEDSLQSRTLVLVL